MSNSKIIPIIALLFASLSTGAHANCKLNTIKGYYTFQLNIPGDEIIPESALTCTISLNKDGSKGNGNYCFQMPIDSINNWGELINVKATKKISGECRFDIELTFDDGKGGGRQTNLDGRMTTDRKGISGLVLQGETPIGGFIGLKTIQ